MVAGRVLSVVFFLCCCAKSMTSRSPCQADSAIAKVAGGAVGTDWGSPNARLRCLCCRPSRAAYL